MIIQIEDLRKGDEIIIPSNSKLRYLKVIREPKLRKRPSRTGNYTNAWCSSRIEVKEQTRTYANNIVHKYKVRTVYCTPDEHNVERYENLNYKTMWLIKREKE